MEPTTAMLILAGAGAGLGAITGERQKAAAERAQEKTLQEQRARDKINMMAQAYGLGGVSPGMQFQPGVDPMGRGMQGALAGAQFAAMNPSLWGDGGGAADPQAALMETVQNQQAQQAIARNVAAQQTLHPQSYMGVPMPATGFNPDVWATPAGG